MNKIPYSTRSASSFLLSVYEKPPNVSQEAWNEVTRTVENEVSLATIAAQGFREQGE